ncbi:hypothetical protein QLH52_19110 [Methylomonas sp. OY6]|uniref:Uncharacterized protein n=1 Tax=Methylomonas defluvii TaxID=3045149 RepID=A0ABU4UK33_9GAMM|nr:hypothetical protein [Methylomonas sp. OY6]MDX8129418.1 hypothetical protein [Methylomonas sp. OY6]
MPATAKDYFNLMVVPTVQEFKNSSYDLRLGLLSTLVLNHIVDHLAQENQLATDRNTMDARVKSKREEILKECQDFQFIWDVADATKHAKLRVSDREVSSSSQLSGSSGLFQAPFGEGVFAEAAVVFAILENGTEKPLLPAVISVFEFLKSKIRP